MRFEGDFQADDCATLGGGESAAGNGAGVFNGETGDITFKGDVEMTNCGTLVRDPPPPLNKYLEVYVGLMSSVQRRHCKTRLSMHKLDNPGTVFRLFCGRPIFSTEHRLVRIVGLLG